MTDEQMQMLDKINKYAEKVLDDIDPQKTPVSYQLEKLKPVMEEIASDKNMKLEDVFIMYMDLASEAAILRENKLQKDLEEGGITDFTRKANSIL